MTNHTNVTTSDLVALSREINDEHQLAEEHAQHAIAHALNAGDLLLEAKANIQHGEWATWLAEHFRGSARTARRYMRLAKHRPELEAKRPRLADLSLTTVEAMLAKPKAEPPHLEMLPKSGMLCCAFDTDDYAVTGFIVPQWLYGELRYIILRVVIGWGRAGSYVEGTRDTVRDGIVRAYLKHLGLPPLDRNAWMADEDVSYAYELHREVIERGERTPRYGARRRRTFGRGAP